MRDNLIPRKGRSHSKILSALKESGISELSGLARVDIATLTRAGIGENEAEQLLTRAKTVYHGQVLREIGIPAVSLKKYLAAGIIDPEAFCVHSPGALSDLTGMSVSTVQRHVELVCRHLSKPVPKKISKTQMERGKKELLAVRGLGEPVLEKLFRADITDADTLLSADAAKLAARSGIPEQKILDYQKSIRKRKETAVIQL